VIEAKWQKLLLTFVSVLLNLSRVLLLHIQKMSAFLPDVDCLLVLCYLYKSALNVYWLGLLHIVVIIFYLNH